MAGRESVAPMEAVFGVNQRCGHFFSSYYYSNLFLVNYKVLRRRISRVVVRLIIMLIGRLDRRLLSILISRPTNRLEWLLAHEEVVAK